MIAIACFELRQYLRRLSTYVYFLVFGSLAFLLFIATAGAFETVVIGLGSKVLVNAPFALNQLISGLSYYAMLVTAGVAGQAVYKDFALQTFPLFFTRPISRFQYLMGRFLAAVLALLGIYLSIGIGCFLGSIMPFIDRQTVGPNLAMAYLQPYLTTVLPNIIITGALFFSVAALSRKIVPVYTASVLLFVGYLIALSLSSKLENRPFASLLDPFGFLAARRVTEYWSIAEKNAQFVPLSGVFLINRAVWLGLALALLAFTTYRFRFVQGGEQREKPSTVEPRAQSPLPMSETNPGPAPRGIALLPRMTWLAFRQTVKTSAFTTIVLAGVLFMFFAALNLGSMFGTNTYPVTYQVVELTSGSFMLFQFIIITYFAGELIWRERDAGIDQLCDTMPIPSWLPLLAKLLALLLIVVYLQCVVLVCGVLIQAFQGYFRFEPGIYVAELFGFQLVYYWLFCVLAFLIQVVINQKYVGHFAMVLLYLVLLKLSDFNIQEDLFQYGYTPGHTYSDMNGFGRAPWTAAWYYLYWIGWALLFGVVSYLLWVRGLETRPFRRLRQVPARWSRPVQALATVGFLLATGVGGLIYYNTHVRVRYRTEHDTMLEAVEYERQYKALADEAQPKITGVTVAFDVFQDTTAVRARGAFVLRNKSGRPIPRLYVNVGEEARIERLAVGALEGPTASDARLGFYTFEFAEPLQPNAETTLEFDLDYGPRGFRRGGAVGNGTFFNNFQLPAIGYQEQHELTGEEVRRKYELPFKERMPDLDDAHARQVNFLRHDADWIHLDATVSTASDQFALAPGTLVKDWEAGGRRYFRYQSDGPVLNFYSVLSARYAVRQERWQDVAIDIYYHPGHEYNLDRMVEGVQKALAYYTAQFGPYQHRHVRIVEFPRVLGGFAQSFPNTIPFSEAIGFIARVKPDDPKDIDYPFYVTAHEVAHQWWGHQVIGGNVQGAAVLTETLAQYSALMVMKQTFGAEQMKRFLAYELDRYLMGRGFGHRAEVPLLRSEDQDFIHYNKGSLVMYALQDYIGEENLNRALRRFVQAKAFQEPPYTYTRELLAFIRQETPPDRQYLLEDLFEKIILYDNQALSATCMERGPDRFDVHLKFRAKKLRADATGEEVEVPFDDLIDIGVLDAQGKFLYLKKHKVVAGEQEIVVTVSARPATAGIDPLHKLIDRKPDDNVVDVQAK